MLDHDGEPGAARLVHDLRTPLAIADGFSALLERDTGELTPEQRADYVRRVRAACGEMRRMLDAAAGGL